MADTIKGLTAKIGADTKDFNKALRATNKEINATEKQVNALVDSLENVKFDENKFRTAQQAAQNNLTKTNEKAEALRKQLQTLEDAGQVNTAQYVNLQTELVKTETKAVQLEQQLKQINAIKFTNLGNSLQNLGGNLTRAGQALTPVSIAAGVAAAGIVKLGKDAIKTADDIKTLATNTGIGVEELQKLEFIGIQSDVSLERLTKGVTQTRDAFGRLARGEVNAATRALTELGLVASDFKSSDQAFLEFVKRLSTIEDASVRASLASDVFGKKVSVELESLVAQGGDALNKYAAEIEAIGVLSEDTVNKLADFDNELNKITKQIQLQKVEIGAAFLPLIKSLTNYISSNVLPVLKRLGDFFASLSQAQQENIFKILLLTAVLAPALLILGKLTTVVGSIVKMIPILNAALTALVANPVVAIIAAVAILLGLMLTQSEELRKTFGEIAKTLGAALAPILKVVSDLLNTLFKALAPILEILGNLLAVALQPFIKNLKFLVPILNAVAKVLDVVLTILEPIFWVMNGIAGLIGKIGGLFGLGSTTSVESPTVTSGVGNTASGTINAGNVPSINRTATTTANTSNISTNSNNTYNVDKIEIVNQAGDSPQTLLDKINQAFLLQAKQGA
jgi:predicted  nucleic acid-binding Zn-ribbon protein